MTGIFEEHKLLFSLQITIKLEQDLGNLTQEQLEFFIKVRRTTGTKYCCCRECDKIFRGNRLKTLL